MFWSPWGAYFEGNAKDKIEGNVGDNAEDNVKDNAKGNAENNPGGNFSLAMVSTPTRDVMQYTRIHILLHIIISISMYIHLWRYI